MKRNVSTFTAIVALAGLLLMHPALSLGIKPTNSALSMGVSVTFVMAITAASSWIINHWILIPNGLDYLQIVSFILVIASLVQLVEMFIRKINPPLYQAMGIYLPLITTNCCIMGLALIVALKNYDFLETVVFGVGAGLGFSGQEGL